jgi:hypothetical protein
MGRAPRPTVGYWSEPCQAEAAKAAFDGAVVALLKEPTPKPALPQPKRIVGPSLIRRKRQPVITGIEPARKYYLDQFANLDQSKWDAEEENLIDAIHEIVAQAPKGDAGDIPDFLDRKLGREKTADGRSDRPAGDATSIDQAATA